MLDFYAETCQITSFVSQGRHTMEADLQVLACWIGPEHTLRRIVF
jgi:hypothetical protein